MNTILLSQCSVAFEIGNASLVHVGLATRTCTDTKTVTVFASLFFEPAWSFPRTEKMFRRLGVQLPRFRRLASDQPDHDGCHSCDQLFNRVQAVRSQALAHRNAKRIDTVFRSRFGLWLPEAARFPLCCSFYPVRYVTTQKALLLTSFNQESSRISCPHIPRQFIGLSVTKNSSHLPRKQPLFCR